MIPCYRTGLDEGHSSSPFFRLNTMSSELENQVFIPIKEDHCHDIQVYGIKRSGNHAIIPWILGHFENYIHYNNCIVDEKSNVFFREHETPIFPTGDSRKLISFEDSLNFNRSNIELFGQCLPPAKTRILIIRDPYNTYASRMKMAQSSDESRGYIATWQNPKIWEDVAKEFLGITNHFNASIKINYNLWVRDINYRKSISANFGEFTDKNFNRVSSSGQGSSFDGVKYDGKASEMTTRGRWRTMIDDKDFKKIITNKTLNGLSKKIFGHNVLVSL